VISRTAVVAHEMWKTANFRNARACCAQLFCKAS